LRSRSRHPPRASEPPRCGWRHEPKIERS
jgi:hypothetical protein